MRFIVVGASGFLGRHILKLAHSLGYEAIGTQSRSNYPDLITFDLLQDRLETCLPSSFLESDVPTFGVICAAVTPMDRCIHDQENSYKVMVTNTIQLIESMVAFKIKPVFMSTSFVYDGKVGYYNEQQPYSPISEYGRNKAIVDEYLQKKQPKALVLRLDKIVGDQPSENHLFSEWHQLVKQDQPIICIQDQLFSPTLVDDIARATISGCEHGLTGVYNTTNSEFFTREELARQFVFALGKEAKIISKPQDSFNFLSRRPLKSYLDSTKLVKALGIRFTSMREVINSFISLQSQVKIL